MICKMSQAGVKKRVGLMLTWKIKEKNIYRWNHLCLWEKWRSFEVLKKTININKDEDAPGRILTLHLIRGTWLCGQRSDGLQSLRIALFDLLYNKCLARGSETEAICYKPIVINKHCAWGKTEMRWKDDWQLLIDRQKKTSKADWKQIILFFSRIVNLFLYFSKL